MSSPAISAIDSLLQKSVLQRNGCPLHYWIGGPADKPLIVFIHGATVDHRMFEAQIAPLIDQYRVLAVDMRGHGESQPMGESFTVPLVVDDLIAILDKIGTKQAIFVGQSTGGYVAQELVFRHPERVKALVMVDCVCITLKMSFTDKLLLGMTPALLKMYPYETLKKQTAQQSSIRPDVQAYIVDAVSKLSKKDYITIWTGIANCIHGESNYRITQPILLVRGDHDKLGNIAKSALEWVARDGCEYVIIPDAGHNSNQDNPTFFNDHLITFLARV